MDGMDWFGPLSGGCLVISTSTSPTLQAYQSTNSSIQPGQGRKIDYGAASFGTRNRLQWGGATTRTTCWGILKQAKTFILFWVPSVDEQNQKAKLRWTCCFFFCSELNCSQMTSVQPGWCFQGSSLKTCGLTCSYLNTYIYMIYYRFVSCIYIYSDIFTPIHPSYYYEMIRSKLSPQKMLQMILN